MASLFPLQNSKGVERPQSYGEREKLAESTSALDICVPVQK